MAKEVLPSDLIFIFTYLSEKLDSSQKKRSFHPNVNLCETNQRLCISGVLKILE